MAKKGMLVAAAVLLLGILLAGCVSSGSREGSPEENPEGNSKENQTNTQEKTFSLAEISGYSTRENCLIAINGSVYNVTGAFGKHPGGDKALLSGCGKDATELFSEKHGGKDRPYELLPSFYSGKLTAQ